MTKVMSQKLYACLVIALSLFALGIATTSLAQGTDTDRQNEISAFWRTVMKQLNNIDIAQL